MQNAMNNKGSSISGKRQVRKASNGLILSACLMLFAARSLWPAEIAVPANDAALNDILVRARQSVDLFWRQFESVSCIENVLQEKLEKAGSSEYKQKSTFDYLVLFHQLKDDLSVEESRLQQGKERNPKKVPLLLTSGLPTLLLVFHSYYAESFVYHIDGDEAVNGHRIARIQFRAVEGKPATTALRLREINYPLSIQGIAWIDAETGSIQRIAAGLTAPIKDLNLKALQMEVSYLPQKFAFKDQAFWLPSTATVKIQSEHQQWRNIHQYSKYRLFSVTSEETSLKASNTSSIKR
jgi:hypothetical protein